VLNNPSTSEAGARARVYPVDLHEHSTMSDGYLAPADLVHEAKRRGLLVLGLTDHDTVAGVDDALIAARADEIELVPGVEMSSEEQGREAHILGYFVRHRDPLLIDGLASFERQRLERVERIVDRLRSLGMAIELERVFQLAGPGTVGRPHVARALIEQGYVATVSEAFDRYLAAGRPGFIPRRKVLPEEAIDLIRRGGGVAALAHPHTVGDVDSLLRRLVPAGLGGIEALYGDYDEATRSYYVGLARAWGLIETGGSDFHRPDQDHGKSLGVSPVPLETVERLRIAAADPREIAW
jgi:predicted metal-dependent phosphoesterase TrpH